MLATLILDRTAPFSSNGTSRDSLLSMPLGLGGVLEHLAGLLAQVGSHRLFIMGDTEAGANGETTLPSLPDHEITILGPDGLVAVVGELEPSDRLLLVDARYWPSRGHDFSIVLNGNGFPGATHVVAVGTETDGSVEHLYHDGRGRVQGVRRLYNGVTRVELKNGRIPFSLAPASAIHAQHFTSLRDLRISMVTAGVLSRDVPLKSDVVDLASNHGFLKISEQVVTALADGDLHFDYSRLSRGVLTGRGCLIAESARIIPPVIIQRGARVEEDVRLIGPTLIGAHSTIKRGAVVAQAMVPRGVTVPERATVRHCVASAGFAAGTSSRRSCVGELSNANDDVLDHPSVSSVPALGIAEPDDNRIMFLGLKRAVDCSLALLALILLLPLLAVVAASIKLTSRGPILFVHDREGRGGRRFLCYKFRTMYRDAHREQRRLYAKNAVDGPQFKLRVDSRITRIGHLLRNTNIDELPQLVNVLLGHMSLVGPRPSPFRENQICVPWRRARLSVRPGITGLWQICRESRGAGDFQQWIYYDMLYVRKASAWVDLKIVLGTVLSLGGKWRVPLSWVVRDEEWNPAPLVDAMAAAS